jgi:glycosyltransferase involved in cell wall biosynthesis
MSFRILHVISSVNPKGGGPIEGLKQLSSVNKRNGHVVEVASLDDPEAEWVKNCPLPCHALGPGHIGSYLYSPRLVPWLKAHRHEYDAVIVNGIWQYHAFGAWRALKGSATPYFVFTHGMLDPWFKRHYPLKHLKKWLFWPWGEYRVLRDAAAVMFTCEDERRLARQSFWLYKCDEYVVSYGTSAPPPEQQRQLAAFGAQFPALQDKRQLLFLGRVHEKKGADLLFKAFAAHKQRGTPGLSDVQIVMAGPADHAYGHEMQALVKSLNIQQSEAGIIDVDTQEGTERLIGKWLSTPPDRWARMRENAKACFDQRFLIDRTADSFIEAMEVFGMRRSAMRAKPDPHAQRPAA